METETEKKPLSDADKLRFIADWFVAQKQHGDSAWTQDLRRIADSLERAAAPIPPNTPAEATGLPNTPHRLVPNQWPGVLDHLDAIDAFITAQESAKAEPAPEPQKKPRFDHTTWPLGAWVRRKGDPTAIFQPGAVTAAGLRMLTDWVSWAQVASDWEMTTDGGKTWRDCVP